MVLLVLVNNTWKSFTVSPKNWAFAHLKMLPIKYSRESRDVISKLIVYDL